MYSLTLPWFSQQSPVLELWETFKVFSFPPGGKINLQSINLKTSLVSIDGESSKVVKDGNNIETCCKLFEIF